MKRGRASATARTVAAATLLSAGRGVGPAPTAAAAELTKSLLEASRAGRAISRLVSSRPGRRACAALEDLLLPGFSAHIARRKAWIAEHAARAVGDGASRVIILGGGLDPLGILLARDRRVRVIEIDHQATLAIKRRALGSTIPPSVCFLSVDLAESRLTDALARLAVADGPTPEKTLVIAEGLLMYLPAASVERLADDIAAIHGPSSVISTFMERRAHEPIGFAGQSSLTRAWLRLIGEPFRWAASRDDATAMFTSRGFRLVEMSGGTELARRWPGPIVEGEVVLVAERP